MNKIGFPEDDERDLEREVAETENAMDDMMRDFGRASERRNYLRKELEKKQLDPLVKKALELAQNLGHVMGANEALANRITKLEKRIEVRDEELERTADRDQLRARALEAEATLERSKKARTARRSR